MSSKCSKQRQVASNTACSRRRRCDHEDAAAEAANVSCHSPFSERNGLNNRTW
jgi:hypothetical protein